MMVNVLYYAVSAALSVQIGRQSGTAAAAVFACLSFVLLVLVGEMTPKSLAYSNSHRFSLVAAPAVFICLNIFTPLYMFLHTFIITPAVRLMAAPGDKIEPITTRQLKHLMDSSRKQGLISADENEILGSVLELGSLKVRQVMCPRIDMPSQPISASTKQLHLLMKKESLLKLPIYSKNIDDIVGIVTLRDILLELTKKTADLIDEVDFIPEQKTVESLLELFLSQSKDTAVVVDEYGQIAGIISLEQVIEYLLGRPPESTNGIEPIELLGPMRYRLAGNLAIHDWADAFDIDAGEFRFSTIARLTTALLGKIPESGDVARLKNVKFTVESVKNHRIETIILSLEPVSD